MDISWALACRRGDTLATRRGFDAARRHGKRRAGGRCRRISAKTHRLAGRGSAMRCHGAQRIALMRNALFEPRPVPPSPARRSRPRSPFRRPPPSVRLSNQAGTRAGSSRSPLGILACCLPRAPPRELHRTLAMGPTRPLRVRARQASKTCCNGKLASTRRTSYPRNAVQELYCCIRTLLARRWLTDMTAR